MLRSYFVHIALYSGAQQLASKHATKNIYTMYKYTQPFFVPAYHPYNKKKKMTQEIFFQIKETEVTNINHCIYMNLYSGEQQ